MFRKKSTSSTSSETFVRRGNFMTKPDKGWLHDDNLLAHGKGVYYCFPVRYIGSVQVLASLNALDLEQKTELCREAIARAMETAKTRKKTKRKTQKYFKQYLADAPYVKIMEIKLNISSEGIATSDFQSNNVLSNDPIGKISFATGGEKADYPVITYVAKDKRENRYCHVFDCGALADDILATLGQVFTLNNEPKKKEPAPDEGLKGVAALKAAQAAQSKSGPASNPMYFERAGMAPAPPSSNRPVIGATAPLQRSPTYDNRDKRQSEGSVYGDDDKALDFSKRRPSVMSSVSNQAIYTEGDGGYLDNPQLEGKEDGGYLDKLAIYDTADQRSQSVRRDQGYLQMPPHQKGGAVAYLESPAIYDDGSKGPGGYLESPSIYDDGTKGPGGSKAQGTYQSRPQVRQEPQGVYSDIGGDGGDQYLADVNATAYREGDGQYLADVKTVAYKEGDGQYLADVKTSYLKGDAGYLANPQVGDQYLADVKPAYLGGDSGYLSNPQIYESLGALPSEEIIRIANEKFQSQTMYDDPDKGNIYGDGKTGWGYLQTQGVERSLVDALQK